jgi:hypothetical protein
MRKAIRCFSYATICAALLLVSASTVFAHTDPAGANATGVGLSITVYRSNGTTPVFSGSGDVTECETIVYETTLSYVINPNPNLTNAAFFGGSLSITTPDGVAHDVTPVGGIPCIGGSLNDPNHPERSCVGAPTSITSLQVSYTVLAADLPGGSCSAGDSLTAQANYTGGTAHIGTDDTASTVSGSTPLQLPVTCCPADSDVCNGTEFCDPTLAFTDPVNGQPRLGTCAPGTPLDCTTADLCDVESCDATLGCQAVPVVCTQDDNLCNDEACDPADGICKSGPTDTCPDDGDLCTSPEECVPATGLCAPTGSDVVCSDPTCELCDPTTGVCAPRVPLPAECEENEEICRTPGFWGTHGGTEKEGHSTNITLAVLGAYCGTLEICGTPVTNTDECSVESALEAICVSPKGNSCLQLGRQLTAAALNCAITKSTNSDTGACQFPDCEATPGGVGAACEGLSIGAIFAACNEECGEEPCSVTAAVDLDDNPDTPDVTVNCIGALDCFNNGLTIDTATGECTDTLSGCHERELCGDFQPPGAAGSPGECSDSRKNCVSIFGATDQCDDACVP